MSARVETIPDGDGGVAAALGCADGRAVIRLCGCGCSCCGTGNQCRLWADIDQPMLDSGDPSLVAAAGVSYHNRVNGWTRLGAGFDVVVTVSGSYAYKLAGGGIEGTGTLDIGPRRVRYRLGPVPEDASPTALAALFGAPASGEWVVWEPATRWVPDGEGWDQEACQYWWVDQGVATGEHTWNEAGEPDATETIEDGPVGNLDIAHSPLRTLLFLVPPVRRQTFLGVAAGDAPSVVTGGDPISPILCDGVVWGPVQWAGAGPGGWLGSPNPALGLGTPTRDDHD